MKTYIAMTLTDFCMFLHCQDLGKLGAIISLSIALVVMLTFHDPVYKDFLLWHLEFDMQALMLPS